MDCFICGVRFDSVRFMTNHFRLFHELPEKHNYQCTFNGDCNTLFASLSSLTRHYKGHIPVQTDNIQRNLVDIHDQSHPEYVYPSSSQQYNPALSPAPSVPNFNQHAVLNSLDSSQEKASIEKCGVHFTLDLHNNNNFTRKDVLNIQKSVITQIVNPIVDSVNMFFNQFNHSHDLEHRLQLTSLVQEISNPFNRALHAPVAMKKFLSV